MNVATGSLMLLGLILLAVGMTSKLMGISLLEPFVSSYLGYFVAANTCLLMALVIDKFQQR